ncbi:MAG: hypothetical protein Q9201_007053 [Fulgogasparrea decipioides]
MARLEYLELAIREWREEAINKHLSSDIERKALNRVVDHDSTGNPGLHHAASSKKSTSVVRRDIHPASLEADRGTVSNETEEVNWDQYIRQDMHSSAGCVDLNVDPAHLTMGMPSVSAGADMSAASESSLLGRHSQTEESEHGAGGPNGSLDDLFLPGAQFSPPISAPSPTVSESLVDSNNPVPDAAQKTSDGHTQSDTPSGNGEPSLSVSTMPLGPTISDDHDSTHAVKSLQSAVDENSGLPQTREAGGSTFSEDLSLPHPTKASDPNATNDLDSKPPVRSPRPATSERHSSPPCIPNPTTNEALSLPNSDNQIVGAEPSATGSLEPTTSKKIQSPPSTPNPITSEASEPGTTGSLEPTTIENNWDCTLGYIDFSTYWLASCISFLQRLILRSRSSLEKDLYSETEISFTD